MESKIMTHLEPREIYDEFILGIATGIILEEPAYIYSKKRIIEYLFQNMYNEPLPDINGNAASISYDRIELVNEYFDFNIANAYVGPTTPIFLEEDINLHD